MIEPERPFPGIFRYARFLDPRQCDFLINKAEQSNIWVPAPIGRYQDNELVESKIDPQLRDVAVCDLEEINIHFPDAPEVQELHGDLVKRFDAPIDVMSRGMISKYVVGSHIRAHRDTGVYSTNRLVTCVVYLNDGYVGGALVFPQLAYSLKPEAGDCLCFYSEYLHGVEEITGGARYCVVWFGESSSVETR